MKWISVKDRLPFASGQYLIYGTNECCFRYPTIHECEYEEDEQIFLYGEYLCKVNVSHWMLLPKPPKE